MACSWKGARVSFYRDLVHDKEILHSLRRVVGALRILEKAVGDMGNPIGGDARLARLSFDEYLRKMEDEMDSRAEKSEWGEKADGPLS